MSTTTQHTFKITLIGNLGAGVQGSIVPPERFQTALEALRALESTYLPLHREDKTSRLQIVDEQAYPCSIEYVMEKARQELHAQELAKRRTGVSMPA